MTYFKYLLNYFKSFVYDVYYYFLGDIPSRIMSDNYRVYLSKKHFPGFHKHGLASKMVNFYAQKYCRGRGLDIGSSTPSLPGARAVENTPSEHAEDLQEKDDSLDFVFSSHLLEHLSKPFEALDHWINKIKPGGYCFLYLPHPGSDHWSKKNLPFHLWNPNPLEMEKWVNENNRIELVEISYLPDGYLSFVTVFKKK